MRTFEEKYGIYLKIAEELHRGQFRKDGITPYFTHVLNVTKNARMLAGKDSFYTITLAIFHDTIEDCDITIDELINKVHLAIDEDEYFKKETISRDCTKCLISELKDVLPLITHDKNTPYEDYIRKLKPYTHVKLVKIADILDNLSSNPSEKQRIKYARALEILREEN